MLSDLLILEHFYGHPACTQFFEDLAGKYGAAMVRRALQAGQLMAHPVVVGPDSGRLLLGLTDKGRAAAR